MEEELGTIRVSPQVVAAIIGLSAADVSGVAWLNTRSGGQRKPLRSPDEVHRAVRLDVQAGYVQADIYLTVERGANMMQVGATVQQEVSEAIRRMLGLDVREINVYIVDVVR
jgi:uncharacterized alkaline shock family protein YloU